MYTDLKTEVGYDTKLSSKGKALFEEELLAWEKAYYTTCKNDSKDIQCREAFALKKDEEKARAAVTTPAIYYGTTVNGTTTSGMTKAQRDSFATDRASAVSALET